MSEKRIPWAVGDVVYVWHVWTEGQTPDLGIAVITRVTAQFVFYEVRVDAGAFGYRTRVDKEQANYTLPWRRTPEAAWLAYVERYQAQLDMLEARMVQIRAILAQGMPALPPPAA